MRCGTKIINGIEILANAKIFKSPLGRDCYVSAILEKEMYIRYVDGNTPIMQKIRYNPKLV